MLRTDSVALLRRRPENFHPDDSAREIKVEIRGGSDYCIAILTRYVDKDPWRHVVHPCVAPEKGQRVIVPARLGKFEGEVGQIPVFIHGHCQLDWHALVHNTAALLLHHVRLKVDVILEPD